MRSDFTLVLALLLASSLCLGACGKSPQRATTTPAQAPPQAAVPQDARGAPSAAVPSADAPAAATTTTAEPAKAPPGPPLRTFALPQRAESGRTAAATAHPLATRAAMRAIHAGGTAVDALVSATLVLSVVTPQSTGIGGGGFAIVRTPDGKATAWDFREAAPAAGKREDYLGDDGKPVAQRSQRHGLAVGVPGTVAGLWALHQRYGKRPWAELCEPAIEAAERGFAIGTQLVEAADWVWDKLDPSAHAILAPGGVRLKAGEVLRQPALGATMRAIAEKGPEGFYAGAVAADIVATVQRKGGKLRASDLKEYAVREVEPLRGEAFGTKVLTMPQPSAGGAQFLAMAEMLPIFLAAARGHHKRLTGEKPLPTGQQPGPIEAHALLEAMRDSFHLRLGFSGDPGKPARTLDDVYPKKARKRLRSLFSGERATPSGKGELRAERHDNTSHVSIVDADGMAVSSTHTVNLLFGAGIVGATSGVWLNNELDDFAFDRDTSNAFGLAGSEANLFRPGARPVSSMTPVIASDKAGVRLVVGSPGGTRIPTTVLLVAWRALDLQQPLEQAVAAPRLHHQAFPDEAWIEPDGAPIWQRTLEAMGHKVVVKRAWCNVQAVSVKTEGGGRRRLEAVSDPRGEGGAMGL
ncbi:MAG: gamma-glutamyltransferase [Deltaproteobacteria bacterium]|nr:gamma-glutamyltransferase [Deltaproteobacteria bacterium]